MYLLGREFRERYILADSGLNMSDIYDPYKLEVSAEAISHNITLQSAEAFMIGLYPVGTGKELDKDYPISRGVPPYNSTYMTNISMLPRAAVPMKFTIIPIHAVD